jgi:hypothetical protein
MEIRGDQERSICRKTIESSCLKARDTSNSFLSAADRLKSPGLPGSPKAGNSTLLPFWRFQIRISARLESRYQCQQEFIQSR